MPANRMIPIPDAKITYRNFEGARTQFNAEGNRNFNLILTEEQYQMLTEMGFKVKVKPPREGETDPRYLLQVSVSYKNRPPKIQLITKKAHRDLTEETVGELDHIDIAYIDLTINASPWSIPSTGASGIKAYLNSMYVTVMEDAFAEKYANMRDDQN